MDVFHGRLDGLEVVVQEAFLDLRDVWNIGWCVVSHYSLSGRGPRFTVSKFGGRAAEIPFLQSCLGALDHAGGTFKLLNVVKSRYQWCLVVVSIVTCYLWRDLLLIVSTTFPFDSLLEKLSALISVLLPWLLLLLVLQIDVRLAAVEESSLRRLRSLIMHHVRRVVFLVVMEGQVARFNWPTSLPLRTMVQHGLPSGIVRYDLVLVILSRGITLFEVNLFNELGRLDLLSATRLALTARNFQFVGALHNVRYLLKLLFIHASEAAKLRLLLKGRSLRGDNGLVVSTVLILP